MRGVKNVDRQTDQVENRLSRLGKFMQSQLGQIAKMALGFFTVVAAVNALQGALRIAVRIAQQIVSSAFEAFRVFESTKISLQAALASQLRLSGNAAENFRLMGDVADVLVNRLIDIDRQSAATFDELVMGFQTFVATGGLRMVSTLEEALQATNLIVNASRIFSRQTNQQMALLTNMRGILQGNSFQMAEVLQVIARSGAEWKEQLRTIEAQRNLLPVLRDRLSGVDLASQELGRSTDGILTSLQTIRDLLLRAVFTEIFERMKTGALSLIQAIERNRQAVNVWAQVLAQMGLAFLETGRAIFNLLVSQIGQTAIGFLLDKIFDLITALKLAEKAVNEPSLLLPQNVLHLGAAFLNAQRETNQLRLALAQVEVPQFLGGLNILNRFLGDIAANSGNANDNLKELSKNLKAIPIRGIPSLLRPGERVIPRAPFAREELHPVPGFVGEAVPPPEGIFQSSAAVAQLAGSIQILGEEFDRATMKQNFFSIGLSNLKGQVVAFSDEVAGVLVGIFQTMGNLIADAVAGVEDPLAKFFAGILGAVGNFAIQLGSFMIMLGLGLQALFTLNPVALIAIGAALVAIGGLLKGLSSRIGGTAAASGPGSTFQAGAARPTGPEQIQITLGSLNVSQGLPAAAASGSVQQSINRLNANLERIEAVPAEHVLSTGFRNRGGVEPFMSGRDRDRVRRSTFNRNPARRG